VRIHYNTGMSDTVQIRDAVADDIPALQEIYNHYILNTTVTFDIEPVSLENRMRWFSHYAPGSRHQLLVAVKGSTPVGYATSSIFREKAAYATSVESSIYIHPGHTGEGIGHRLYARLLQNLLRTAVHRVYACITLPNPVSVSLHCKLGFVTVGVFREAGYKFSEYRDVQWMELAL